MTPFKKNFKKKSFAYRGNTLIPDEILREMPPYSEAIDEIRMALIYFKLGPYENGYIYGLAYDPDKDAVFCMVSSPKDNTVRWFDVEELQHYRDTYGTKLTLDELQRHPKYPANKFNPHWLTEEPHLILVIKQVIF